MPPKKKLLIVDDDLRVREATRFAFEEDFEILEAAGVESALQSFDSKQPDVVFLDVELNGLPEGWEILREVRKRGRETVIAIVTGAESERDNPLAGEADGFFMKPTDLASLMTFLRAKGMLS